ncbi:MAG: AsmA family protein [Sphingomonas sp.]|nr:AsmA family protein [Sphingomonas sp.]
MSQALLVDPPLVSMPRRRRLWPWGLLALPLAGWTALALGAATPLKGVMERHASAALGRTVTISGPLRVVITPFSLRLLVQDLHIANASWASRQPLLDVRTATIEIATADLLLGRPGIRALTLNDGALDLERSADSQAVNWAGAKPGTLLDAKAIQRIDADNLAVHYRDPARQTEARLMLRHGGRGIVDLIGSGVAGEQSFRVSGTAQSATDRLTRFDLRARTPDFALTLKGDAEAPLRLADARLTGMVEGRDFARLAALGGIALPAMPAFRLSARIGHVAQGWHFSHVDGRIGNTDLAGKVTLDGRRARPLLVAQLRSRTLDLADAKTLFAIGAVDAGEDGVPAASRLLPDAPLSPEALGQFDAVVDFNADRVTGSSHAPAHMTMKLALLRGIMQISPMSVDLAGGFVSSDLLIDARQRPALVRADIRLSPTPMGRLLADWGIAPGGTTAMVKGRLQLAGRGETLRDALGTANGRMALVLPAGAVRVRPASASALDMASLSDAIFQKTAQEATPADLNCGLIAFTVRDGVATADPILIDTDDHVLSGSGRIDLRAERLDMRLSAQGKGFAFFGRPSPLLIGGTLSDPMTIREPVSWFRPARLFGLSMILPDFGAILGFVDPDEADAPACGPILRAAPATAQRKREDARDRADLR